MFRAWGAAAGDGRGGRGLDVGHGQVLGAGLLPGAAEAARPTEGQGLQGGEGGLLPGTPGEGGQRGMGGLPVLQ